MMFEKGFPLYYRFQEVLKLKLVLYQHTKNLQEENRRLSELLEEQVPLNLLRLQPFAFQARPLDILPNLFEFGSIEIEFPDVVTSPNQSLKKTLKRNGISVGKMAVLASDTSLDRYSLS